MNVRFKPLTEADFPLLLQWLESPHVKKWWDHDVVYTRDLIQEKYGDYVKGYTKIHGSPKPMSAYIIHADDHPVGYSQVYDAYDFPRNPLLTGLPKSLGAFDILIGEIEFLGHNIGSLAIQLFVETYVFPKYRYAFADPDYRNEAAVRAYEKAGLVILKRVDDVFWMVSHKHIVRLSTQDLIALEVTFRECFLKHDKLWVFGSRADMCKKGGDIDLYIETEARSVEEALMMKLKFLSCFKQAIGDQKVDLVLNILNAPCPLPIQNVAKAEGVNIL